MEEKLFDKELKKEINERSEASKRTNLSIIANQIKRIELRMWEFREKSERLKESGIIARRSGDNNAAKEKFKESIEIDNQIENELKTLYEIMLEKSDPLLEKDKIEYRKIEESKNLSIIQNYVFLAELYEKEKSYLDRQECCKKGLELFHKISDPEPFVLFLSGCLYHLMDGTFLSLSEKNGKKAILCFEESIRKGQKSEKTLDTKACQFSYERLGYIYQDSKVFYNVEKAYACFFKAEEYGLDCKEALARYKKTLFGKIKFLGKD